jgi:putative membrane protein
MAIAESVRDRGRAHPRAVTAVVSVVGYAVVLASFGGVIPFPTLSTAEVRLFSDAIAAVNTVALTAIVAGVAFVRRGQIRRHRAAMLTAFGLILVFLVLYVWKQAGGFTKEFVVPAGAPLAGAAGAIELAYTAMLAVHVLLSILAVPVVVHAVVLGLTHSPSELPETAHPRVGRVAVAAWGTSLFLGVVTYLMLNHVYGWERLARGLILLALAVPARR